MSTLASLATQTLLALQDAPRPKNFWFPAEASTVAREIDDVFYFILWVSIVSFVLVIGATLLFAWKYRERAGHKATVTSSHDNRLELTWTIVPTILVAVMFWVGFKGFLDLRTPPEGAYEVQVTGFQWAWEFRYPNGHATNELHVPANRPIRLLMTSTDVLHSLFLPAFRVKQDVVPGRYTVLWFEATIPGTYDLFCTEYCGTSHSAMITTATVHESEEAFEAWLEKDSDVFTGRTPEEAGELLFNKKGCAQCHSVDGSTLIGPSFTILSEALAQGSSLPLDGGGSVTPEENYIRESILYPNAKIRAGYKGVNMTSYLGRIKDEEIGALIAYIKSLHPAQ
jgi:cytochrome c oxidase subunit 2